MNRLALITCAVTVASAMCARSDAPPDATEALPPVPTQEVLVVAGHSAFVIMPPAQFLAANRPTPWVLYAPTFANQLPGAAEAWMFRRFVAAGIAIGGIDIGESYGNPKGRALYSALHRFLVDKRGFAPNVSLLARSRGGLMLYNWAAEHPQRVECIAGIYPVCDLTSYPGLKKAAAAYEISETELSERLSEHNPVDRLKPLAEQHVPILHIHGNVDTVVPLEANSQTVADRYRALKGEMTLIIADGQGHNMWPGFFECRALVDFVIANATEPKANPGKNKPLINANGR